MNEEMKKHFECPICFLLMKPPIYNCVKGHSYCNSCNQKLKECALCRSNLSGSRNFALENLTAFIEYPCKFQQCHHKTFLKDLEAHEINCRFRPYSCPAGSECEWHDSYANMLIHIEEKHKNQLCISNNECFSFDKLTPNKLILKIDKTLFLFTITIDTNFLNISVKTIFRFKTVSYKYNIRFVDKHNIEDVSFTKLCQNYSENTLFQIAIQSIQFAKCDYQCYKAQLKIIRV